MLKSILTATVTAQATNNTMVLPISFTYDEARLFGLVTANKVDATAVMRLVQRELGGGGGAESGGGGEGGEKGSGWSDEEFYQRVQRILAGGGEESGRSDDEAGGDGFGSGSGRRKFRFPVRLLVVIVRASGAMLMLNSGGVVLLRRGAKTGQLTKGETGTELEVRAGRLKEGDILALFNEKGAEKIERIKEDLDAALDWTDFAVYGQAYLAQPGQENLGLVIMKWRDAGVGSAEGGGGEERSGRESEEVRRIDDEMDRMDSNAAEMSEGAQERTGQTEEVLGVAGMQRLDADRVGQVVADEKRRNRWSAFHQNGYIQPQPTQFEASNRGGQAGDESGRGQAGAGMNGTGRSGREMGGAEGARMNGETGNGGRWAVSEGGRVGLGMGDGMMGAAGAGMAAGGGGGAPQGYLPGLHSAGEMMGNRMTDSEEEVEKQSPWEKISGFFKKKISRQAK